MSQATIRRIHLICGIVISVLLVAVGICFIASCIAIYHSGDRPFSRESVSAYFSNIAIPVYTCIAAVIGGGILQWVLPLEPKAVREGVPPTRALERLTARLDRSACPEDTLRAISLQRKLRLLCRATVAALCIACAIPVAIYLFTPGNFGRDTMNADVFSAMLFTVCFFADGALFCIAGSILEGISIRRETALVKQAIDAGAVKKPAPEDGDWKNWGRMLTRVLTVLVSILAITVFLVILLRTNRFISAQTVAELTIAAILASLAVALGLTLYFVFVWKKPNISGARIGLWIARIAIAAVAVIFLIVGIINGGMADVFAKAVRICTECIGLG